MNWTPFLNRWLNPAILCLILGTFGILLFPGQKMYAMLFINLGEIIAITAIWYFLSFRSIYDVLFYNLGLFINGSYPILYNANIANSTYRFLLPIGLAVENFRGHINPIQQYRGRIGKIDYEFDEKINRGIVLIEEQDRLGKRITRSINYSQVIFMNFLVIVLTDYLILRANISLSTIFNF